jgi:hypothetical protein
MRFKSNPVISLTRPKQPWKEFQPFHYVLVDGHFTEQFPSEFWMMYKDSVVIAQDFTLFFVKSISLLLSGIQLTQVKGKGHQI